MKALKYNPEEIDIEVTDISLLTVEEAEQLPIDIRRYDDWWWLRSHGGFSNYPAFVYNSGYINYQGYYADFNFVAVRPVITVSPQSFLNVKFEIGDIIKLCGKKYIVIAPNKLLYDDELVYHRFDESTNDYEKSEIKKVVDEWFD